MKTLCAPICLAALCTSGVAAPDICTSYAADLVVMVQVDQALRERISYDSVPDGKVKEAQSLPVFKQLDIVDRVNTGRLKSLVRACGWPRKSIHGVPATGAAWLLAQHAEPQAQGWFLPHLEAAVRAGEASPSDLAYLTDRVAVREGRLQLYGTQLNQKGPCEFEFSPLDERKSVNERRKAAGMPTLEEYERMFKDHISTRGCPAK